MIKTMKLSTKKNIINITPLLKRFLTERTPPLPACPAVFVI